MVVWCLLVCALALVAGCSDPTQLPDAEAQRIARVFEQGLKAPEPVLRADTVRVVGMAASPKMLPLLQMAVKDKHPVVRASAAVHLFPYQPDTTRDFFQQVFAGDEKEVAGLIAREAFSANTIGSLEDSMVGFALRSPTPEVRRRALEFGLIKRMELIKDKARLDRELLPLLSNAVDDELPQLAGKALRAMLDHGRRDRLEEIVHEAKRGGALGDRRRAIRILTYTRDEGLKDELESVVASNEGSLKVDAEVALVAIGQARDLSTLRDALAGADEQTTLAILYALGHAPERDALRIIRPYRADSRVAVRLAAYKALANHPSADVVDFKRGLTDKDAEVAIAAVRGMVTSNPTAMSGSLREVLKNPRNAGRGLQVLISAAHRMEIDGDTDLLARLETQLKNLDEEILALVASEDPTARAAAAGLLFRREDPLAFYNTIEDPSVEATYALLESLARSPNPEAPLANLELFARYNNAELLSLRIISALGTWRAYAMFQQLQVQ